MTDDRKVKSTTVDGQTTTYLSPNEQVKEDARVEAKKITRNKSMKTFFRTSRLTSQDRP